jgi:hypothetical protein
MSHSISSDQQLNALDQSRSKAFMWSETSVPTILLHYFDTLNAEDFQTTAQLFAEDGVLYPPFESAVVGREAIARYLQTEARGLQLTPVKYVTEPVEKDNGHNCSDTSTLKYRVIGSVQTPLFGVNVSWTIVVNETEILTVRVKLLAALEELLKLKSEVSSG